MKGRFWRKTVAACLALLLVTGNVPINPVADLFGSMAITASAALGDVVDSGYCGISTNEGGEESVSWTLTQNNEDNENPTYTLAISGTGNMTDYNPFRNSEKAPWDSVKENVASVVIGDGVTSIGYFAFYKFTNLTNLSIAGTVTSIGEDAFEKCSSLANITVPANVTSIGYRAFFKCTSLTSISIPDNVTSIGRDALAYCTSLESVTIPESVTSIEQGVFTQDTNLTSLSYGGSAAEWAALTGDVELGIPEGCTMTYLKNDVIIDSNITNGTVTADKAVIAKAAMGDTRIVTLTVTSDEGYAVGSVSVNDGVVDVTDNQDGTYSFIMPAEDVTVTAEFKRVYSDGIGEHLAGHSLSLNGNIGVNFYMELDADVIADPDAYMLFTLPNGKPQDVKIGQATTKTVSGKTYYIFQCNVAAKEMTDTIKAQMFSGNKSGQVYEYTVKDYADYLFANAYEDDGMTVKNQSYVDAIPLVKAMLNYGSYSQTYFSHNTDALANADITDTDVSAITAETVSKPYDSSTAILPSGITLEGANLALESETVLNLYFSNTTGKELTFTTSGNVTLDQKQDGTYTKVTITGIAAQYLDNDATVNVTVAGDDAAYSVQYSPMNYCYNTLSRDTTATRTEALKDVMRAFYLYNQEAKTYFTAHSN